MRWRNRIFSDAYDNSDILSFLNKLTDSGVNFDNIKISGRIVYYYYKEAIF